MAVVTYITYHHHRSIVATSYLVEVNGNPSQRRVSDGDVEREDHREEPQVDSLAGFDHLRLHRTVEGR